MTRYAADTKVSSIQSRMEIERTLTRYGASKFAYASEDARAHIMFEAHGRRIQFVLPLPSRTDREITHKNLGRVSDSWHLRSPAVQEEQYEQAVRQKWRALALLVKAKLEAVESNISTFEDEFLANTVIPTANGSTTVGAWMNPQIDEAYARGMLPTSFLTALAPGRPE